MTATFMVGAATVGSIPLTVSGNGGALLFAATTDQPFTSVVLTAPVLANGFAIAQVSYGLNSTTLTGTTGNAITGVEGSSTGTVLLGTFVDADQAAPVDDYTTGGGSVVVNWGDGSAPQSLAPSNLTPIGTPNGVVWAINAAHTYIEEGTYAYTVTVTDNDGASTIVAGSAIIADAALTAGTPTLLSANTGIACPTPRSSPLSPMPTRSPRQPTSRPPSTGVTARRRAPALSSPPPRRACSTSREFIASPRRAAYDPRERPRRRRFDGHCLCHGHRHRPAGHRLYRQLHRDRGYQHRSVRPGDVQGPQHTGHALRRVRDTGDRRLGRRETDVFRYHADGPANRRHGGWPALRGSGQPYIHRGHAPGYTRLTQRGHNDSRRSDHLVD